MGKLLNLSGQRFGRLTVLGRVAAPGAHNAMWECRCDCGKLTVGAGANLGKTKFSCGCLQSETGKRTLETNRLKRTDLHGESASLEFKTWASLKGRCLNPANPKYPRYGGRGIKVCDRWIDDFQAFLADMGRKPSPLHSIDRIDNDGDYEPSNCHWATIETQTRNRSTTRHVTIGGETLCVRDWASRLGVNRKTFYDMCRATHSGGAPNLSRQFDRVEDAIRHVYRQKVGPIG